MKPSLWLNSYQVTAVAVVTPKMERSGGRECPRQASGGQGIVLEGQVRSGWWAMKGHQLCRGLEVGLGTAVRKEAGGPGICSSDRG